MKKNMLFVVLMFVMNTLVKGQVVLIPEVQGQGIILKQQIFSMVVNNISGAARNSVVVVQVMDRVSSQLLLEATSNQFLLGTGTKRITYNELSPLIITQSSPEFSFDRAINQPLPLGEYVVCYKIFSQDNKKELLASECLNISAEALSPPQLVQPENAATITETRPVFTWTPPSPVSMFFNLSYDIMVTEKLPDQSAEEALQRNIPILVSNTSINSLPYAASFTNLQAGKEYAWHVVAKSGDRYAGKSEVWTFNIMPDSVKAAIETAAYIKIQDSRSEVAYLQQGMLKIDYVNHLADSVVKVTIDDMTDVFQKQIVFEIRLNRGQNLIKKDINRLGRLHDDHVYKVTIINSKKEDVYFRFIPKYYF